MIMMKKLNSNQTYIRNIIADNYYNMIQEHAGEWLREWNSAGYGQQNASTNREYSGQNQLNLFFEQLKRNSADPRWMTMTQIIKNNFKLEKGSKGARVEFHSNYTERVKRDETGKAILDENGNTIKEKVLLPFHVGKTAVVFNAKNISGIEPFKIPVITDEQKKQIESEKNQRINSFFEKFQRETLIKINEIPTTRACFISNADGNQIILPLRTQFNNFDSFYSTAFHEMAHATSVLKDFERPIENPTKITKQYAQEELIAETTALLMMREFKGYFAPKTDQQKLNSFAYLKSWIDSGLITQDDFRDAFSTAVDISKHLKNFDIEREKIKSNVTINKTSTNTLANSRTALDPERERDENQHDDIGL